MFPSKSFTVRCVSGTTIIQTVEEAAKLLAEFDEELDTKCSEIVDLQEKNIQALIAQSVQHRKDLEHEKAIAKQEGFTAGWEAAKADLPWNLD